MASVYENLEGGLPRELFQEPKQVHFEIAEANGISKQNVYNRMKKHGWSLERAITEPVKMVTKRAMLYEQHVEKLKENAVSYSTFLSRLDNGWDEERAISEPVVKKIPKTTFSTEEIKVMKQINLPHIVARQRIENGWDRQRATSLPLRKRRRTQ